MLRLTSTVEVEECGPAGLQTLDEAFNHVIWVGDGALHHVRGAVRHGDEADLLARLLLALDGLSVLRHVRHLADETRRTGLPTGVGVDLSVHHQDLDGHARRHDPGEVLKADVVHRSVATHRNHRRAKLPLLVGELAPREVGEEIVVLGRLVLVLQLQLDGADGLEALRHLGHVAFEDAHRHGRGVLEEVVGPGERVGVERIGAAPNRGATGAVDHAHAGPTPTGGALDVLPLEVFQLGHQRGHPSEPALVDRLTALDGLHARGDRGERHVLIADVVHDLGHHVGVTHVELSGEPELDVFRQSTDELGDVGEVLGDPRLHQGFHGGGEDVKRGFLRATHARAVTAGERQVVGLVEEDRLQSADALFDVVHPDVLRRGGRQVAPKVPVVTEQLHRLRRLLDGAQGVIVADLYTLHAALAGVRVDGDREKAATPGLILLGQSVMGPSQRELESVELLPEEVHLLLELFLLAALELALLHGLRHGLVHERCHGVGFLRLFEQAVQIALHELGCLGQMFDLCSVAILAHPVYYGVENLAHLVHQPRDRRVGADRVAVAAGGAVLGQPLGVIETDSGHVPEQRRGRWHHTQSDERIGEVVVAHASCVKAARLLPEAVDVAHGCLALRQRLHHHREPPFAAGGLAVDYGDGAGDHLVDLVETALHHPHVVIHDSLSLGAEFLLELVVNGAEELLLGEPRLFHHRRGGEECTLEGDALHPELEVGIGGLFPRDLESVQVVNLDLLVDDDLLVRGRDALPHLFRRFLVALDDEDAAFFQAGQCVGVPENVRIRRQHHVHVEVLAVDLDRLWRRRQVVRRGLAFLLGAVLGIGLHVVAQEIEKRQREVLARRDCAPATDGVKPHRDAVLGHQVGVLRSPNRQLLDLGIRVLNRLLIHLLLRRDRLVPQEIDRKVEQLFPRPLLEHVLYRAHDALGLEVAASHAEGAGVEGRRVVQ